MPKREPAARQDAGEPPGAKVMMRLDANGRWVPVIKKRVTNTTTEPAERPPQPDDPRSSLIRNLPPFGG
jgi:hypothetical protein